jgi:radical SAM protein with 4Fe4S-binding SPASM domain
VLTTSWDPTGRPLAGETGTKFHQNITHFKRHIAEVTFVLTRPTISRIVQGKTAYLDLLVESGFEIDFDYYMPTAKTEQLMPSDREILEALRVLVRRYPKIRKLRQWTDLKDVPVSTKITCASLNKITILPDGTLTNCRHLNYDQSDFATRILNESNSDMIFNYLARKDCLSCPYFMKCPFSCFVMSDHRTFQARSELDDCLYRILFNETAADRLLAAAREEPRTQDQTAALA